MTSPGDLLWRRWNEIDGLLEEALDLPAAERAAHLVRRAGNDDALRDLLLRLLGGLDADHDRVVGPSEEMVLGAFGVAGDPVPGDLEPGTAVGRYRIGARRGRGGMATVYDAERSDGTYEQRVALKVLRRGLDTEDLIRRFLTERQILSSLAHPNIARLLDGGSLPDGRPYLVMELVEGRPITAYADAERLTIPDRLDLFLQVAGAVQAAHRRLVVHRDIKPSNILVDADGRAKLLDFGIAKLLEADEGITEAGARALTPDYASPEQLRGEPVTTGTDVYQLGLLLRELLSGLPPRAADAPPGEPIRLSRAARLAVTGAPPPDDRAAVRRTTVAGLTRTLHGDLEIIMGKATRDDPEQRYASAEELAADVRRYLAGRPIVAHPESTTYRLRKFAGRHPLFLPATAAVAAGLAAFIILLEVQNAKIRQERDAAEAASRRALATQEFLVDILRSPDPTGAAGQRDITVVEALQQGRGRIATELEDEPEVRAALLEAMGRSFGGLGRYETSDTLLRESLRLYNALHGQTSWRSLGVVRRIGNNYRMRRDFAAADQVYREELQLREAAGPVSDTVRATLFELLSGTRRDLGDIDSAVTLANRAVALRRSAGDTVRVHYTATLGVLAYVLRGANQLDSAEVVYREVLRRQERAAVPDSNALATTHNNLGYLLRVRGDFAGAERSYREAIRLVAEALGEGHPTTLMYTSNLAGALEPQGKLDEIVAIGRARIAAAEQEWPDGHWRVGTAYSAQGRFLLRHAREVEAIAPLEAAVRSFVGTIGVRHTWTVVAEAHLGTALLLAGRDQRGMLLDRSLATLRERTAALDADSRANLNQTATVLETRGHPDRAGTIKQLLGPPS